MIETKWYKITRSNNSYPDQGVTVLVCLKDGQYTVAHWTKQLARQNGRKVNVWTDEGLATANKNIDIS